jgi:hypothetical protein
MAYECCICGVTLHTENPKTYFCSKCYKDWKREIKAKCEWVTCLINFESRRRRWDTWKENGKIKHAELVWGLGNDFDILNNKIILLNKRYK